VRLDQLDPADAMRIRARIEQRTDQRWDAGIPEPGVLAPAVAAVESWRPVALEAASNEARAIR